jgi:single-stranded-DNA-specific exonuclease
MDALIDCRALTGEHELVLRCLLNRGNQRPTGDCQFLNPQFPASLHPPTLLRDMPQAVERLAPSHQQGERILVVTDFDVDGTTSA